MRVANVSGDRVPAGVRRPPEHNKAAERDEGGERPRHLPRIRVHGHRPAHRHQEGEHPQGHTQALHHAPAIQGMCLPSYSSFLLPPPAFFS